MRRRIISVRDVPPSSLYSSDAFEVPNGLSLPYYNSLTDVNVPVRALDCCSFDPYASTTQSRNLRVIETTLNPQYKAKNDTVELNVDYKVTPALTFTSQTGFNNDFLWSTEDYNRFNTAPGAFVYCDPNPAIYCGAYGGAPNFNSLGQLTLDPNGLGGCGHRWLRKRPPE